MHYRRRLLLKFVGLGASPRHSSHCRRAFTLVEILVVVGIMVLLAGILFPVLARVREEGNKTTCVSNLRQLGLALQQYASDNAGVLPLWWDASYDHTNEFPPAQGGICWTNRMLPYFKNWKLVDCPSKTNDRYQLDEMGDYDELGRLAGRPDYFFNSNLVALNENRISHPANVVTFTDSIAYSGQMYGWVRSERGQGGNRHLGGANYAFYDGHVKWIQFDPNISVGKVGKNNSCHAPLHLSMCPYGRE